MKAIYSIAFASVMLTSTAAIACSDIPNPSRFMPESLSAYQECWLDTHKADETAGVVGGLTWVRLGDGSYFSTQLNPIIKASNGDKAKAVEIVTEYIIQEVEADVTSVADQLRDLGISERKIANKMEKMIVRKLRGDNFSLRNGAFKGQRHDNDASDYVAYNVSPVEAGRIANYAKNNGTYDNTGHVRYILVDSNEAWHVEFRAELQAYITEAISTAWSAGYEAGYNDGYKDGYRDGYADGYADGAASR